MVTEERPETGRQQRDEPGLTPRRPRPNKSVARERTVAALAATRDREIVERDQREAANYGVPLEVWQRLSEEQKRQIAVLKPQGYVAPDRRGVREATNDELLAGDEHQLTALDERLRAGVIRPEDEADWTLMYDKVVEHPRFGRVHPGVSRVPRRQIQQKWDQGFRFDPEAPLIPEPTVPCGMPGLFEPTCPFKGHPDPDDPTRSEDVYRHQLSRHPREVEARRELAARRKDEQERLEHEQTLAIQREQLAALQLQNDILRRQTREQE